MTLAITALSLLTPFDTPEHPDGTWRALRAGEHLTTRTAMDDRLLAGPATLDRSIRVALASAQFVEPLLFGRIVDALANGQGGTRAVPWSDVALLVSMWVGFGLFIIGANTMVALHADRLAHRHSQKVRADYFEHVLQLPLSYHTGTHSGRLMKIMLTGTNTLWSLWLSFFREHLTGFVSLLILLPLTL